MMLVRGLVSAMESMKELSELSIIEKSAGLMEVAQNSGLRAQSVAPDLFQTNKRYATIVAKAHAPDATEADIQAWADLRSELAEKAVTSAERAQGIIGLEANYTGKNLISEVESKLGTSQGIKVAPEVQSPIQSSSPQEPITVGRFTVVEEG